MNSLEDLCGGNPHLIEKAKSWQLAQKKENNEIAFITEVSYEHREVKIVALKV